MERSSSHSSVRHSVTQRVAYGALSIIVLVALFLLDAVIAAKSESLEGTSGMLLRRGSVLPVLFVVVLTCGAVELRRLLRAAGACPHVVFAHLMIVVLLLTPWFSAAGLLGSDPAAQGGLHWQLIWLMAAGIGAGVLSIARRDPAGTFRDMGATLLMIVYLGFLGSFGLQLRCGYDGTSSEAVWMLLIVVLVTKASDIGGYFVGSAFGRHKLIPTVSPGKSVEGTIAGLLTSALLAVLVALGPSLAAALELDGDVRRAIASCTFPLSVHHQASALSLLWRAFFFGVIMAMAGQIGDLIESCFKRDAGSKDSGRILPRFGGILDLIDSPILAMPVAWFLLAVVWDVI